MRLNCSTIGADPAVVRAWLRSKGYPCGDGKMPASWIAKYALEHDVAHPVFPVDVLQVRAQEGIRPNTHPWKLQREQVTHVACAYRGRAVSGRGVDAQVDAWCDRHNLDRPEVYTTAALQCQMMLATWVRNRHVDGVDWRDVDPRGVRLLPTDEQQRRVMDALADGRRHDPMKELLPCSDALKTANELRAGHELLGCSSLTHAFALLELELVNELGEVR